MGKGNQEKAFHEELGEIYFYKGISHNWSMQSYHYHATCEIILMLTDGIMVDVNNYSFRTSYGDLILFGSNEPHRVRALSSTEYNRYVIMFDPKVIREMFVPLSTSILQMFELISSERSVRRINLTDDSLNTIIKQLNRIDLHYSMKDDENSRAMIYLLIAELLLKTKIMVEFFKTTPEHADDGMDVSNVSFQMRDNDKTRIQQIKQYICDNVESKLTLDSIASHFFMNKYYLSHYFKKETGFSIIQYIKIQKIQRAKEMLKMGYSIRNVALILNYSSDSHFISSFQKQVGKTPKKYVRDAMNGNN